MDQKDRQIAYLNATNAAAAVCAAAGVEGWNPDVFDTIRDQIFEGSERKIAEFAVVDAFPGAQPVGPAPVAPQPVPVPTGPAPAPAPAPFPAATSGTGNATEALWQHYFARPEDFYNNIADKAAGRSPNGPDFKRKSDKAGLWIAGKYPLPAGVAEQLRARGIIA